MAWKKLITGAPKFKRNDSPDVFIAKREQLLGLFDAHGPDETIYTYVVFFIGCLESDFNVEKDLCIAHQEFFTSFEHFLTYFGEQWDPQMEAKCFESLHR